MVQSGPMQTKVWTNQTQDLWIWSHLRADWTHIYRSEVQASVDQTLESNLVWTWSRPLKKRKEIEVE